MCHVTRGSFSEPGVGQLLHPALCGGKGCKGEWMLCLPSGMWIGQTPGRNLVTITRRWCNRFRGISCGKYGKMALGTDKLLCMPVCVTRSFSGWRPSVSAPSARSLPVTALCSTMRQNPGGKSLHKSFNSTRVRHFGAITLSCNLSSLDYSGHLAWCTGPYSCSPTTSHGTI